MVDPHSRRTFRQDFGDAVAEHCWVNSSQVLIRRVFIHPIKAFGAIRTRRQNDRRKQDRILAAGVAEGQLSFGEIGNLVATVEDIVGRLSRSDGSFFDVSHRGLAVDVHAQRTGLEITHFRTRMGVQRPRRVATCSWVNVRNLKVTGKGLLLADCSLAIQNDDRGKARGNQHRR